MLTMKQMLICLTVTGLMLCSGNVSGGSILSRLGKHSQDSHISFNGLISGDENSDSASRTSPVSPTQSKDQEQEVPSIVLSNSMSSVPISGGVLSTVAEGTCMVSPFGEICRPVVSGWLYIAEFLRFPIPPPMCLLKVPIGK